MRRMIWSSGTLNWYCPAAFVSVPRSVPRTLIWAPSSGRCVAASTTVPFIVPVVCAAATRVQAHVSATQAPRVRSALVQRSGDFISTSCVGKKRDGAAHRFENRMLFAHLLRQFVDCLAAADRGRREPGRWDGTITLTPVRLTVKEPVHCCRYAVTMPPASCFGPRHRRGL